MISLVSENAIARIDRDLRLLFSKSSLDILYPDVPAPLVTLDLIGIDPEPLHVFTWGTARDFSVAGSLSGQIISIEFHVWVTLVATASTSDEAARIANAYQAIALQMTLCDTTLGGEVDEVFVPSVKESDSWADQDGRRHSGYLLDFGVKKYVEASGEAYEILNAANAAERIVE